MIFTISRTYILSMTSPYTPNILIEPISIWFMHIYSSQLHIRECASTTSRADHQLTFSIHGCIIYLVRRTPKSKCAQQKSDFYTCMCLLQYKGKPALQAFELGAIICDLFFLNTQIHGKTEITSNFKTAQPRIPEVLK